MRKKSKMFAGQIADVKTKIIEEIQRLFNEKKHPNLEELELDKHVEFVEHDHPIELNHTVTAISRTSLFFGNPYFDKDEHPLIKFSDEILVLVLDALEETI